MRRQPASAHNTALRIRRDLKQVDEQADPDFYAMAKSYPLPPNCPTDKAKARKNAKGNKSRRSRSRSNSKVKVGKGNGGGNSSTSQRRQRTRNKRRSPSATTGDDVTDEDDSTTKPKSRASSNGRKSRKNSIVSSPRDSYVEPTEETNVEEVAMEGVVSHGQASAANSTMSLAGFSWHQETDALTFLDDPEVQAHGQLLQYGEGATEAAEEFDPVPVRTSSGTGSSSTWPMPSKPSIPTTGNPSTGAVSRPAGPNSMAFANYPGHPEPSLSRSHSHPYQQQQSTSSVFPIESQNYAHRPQQSYGQDQRVDHYQHRQQALDFHSSYPSYPIASSSASKPVSESALSKSEAYSQANTADPIVAKDYSGDNHSQNDNQRLTTSEILPMLQCLFD